MSNDIYTALGEDYLKVSNKIVPKGQTYVISLEGLRLSPIPNYLMNEIITRNLQGIAYFNPEDYHE